LGQSKGQTARSALRLGPLRRAVPFDGARDREFAGADLVAQLVELPLGWVRSFVAPTPCWVFVPKLALPTYFVAAPYWLAFVILAVHHAVGEHHLDGVAFARGVGLRERRSGPKCN
jgi:hypothetical protein